MSQNEKQIVRKCSHSSSGITCQLRNFSKSGLTFFLITVDGSQVTEKHFSSTTLKMAGIDHFRDVGNTVFFFDLKAGAGTDISKMLEYAGVESEILIKSGEIFEIESSAFSDDEDRWVVHLREV